MPAVPLTSSPEALATSPPSAPASLPAGAQAILYFDGECGLCNRWVNFMLNHDRQRLYRYAPLQGETARLRLGIEPGTPLKTLVVENASGQYRRTAAVWRILVSLGGWCAVAGHLLRFVPPFLRDLGYNAVAATRYFWFGRHDTCRLPKPDERALFLP